MHKGDDDDDDDNNNNNNNNNTNIFQPFNSYEYLIKMKAV
jgi:hypothetical protein